MKMNCIFQNNNIPSTYKLIDSNIHYVVLYCFKVKITKFLQPFSGADPGFQVRGGGGALKKIAPGGGRRENFWGISCEKLHAPFDSQSVHIAILSTCFKCYFVYL